LKSLVKRAVPPGERLMKAFIGLPILGLALSATQATAWDNFGHMEVAALASAQLTPKAQSRAAELLKLNPAQSSCVPRDIIC
jgi:hypothetical protein